VTRDRVARWRRPEARAAAHRGPGMDQSASEVAAGLDTADRVAARRARLRAEREEEGEDVGDGEVA
jgi:hypothetical protein